MALSTTTVFIPKGEVQEFSDVIGVVNDSHTAVYYDFADMPDKRGGIPLVKRGDEDKFPTSTIYVRSTTAGSNVILIKEA